MTSSQSPSFVRKSCIKFHKEGRQRMIERPKEVLEVLRERA
jgi:hypothetical protein